MRAWGHKRAPEVRFANGSGLVGLQLISWNRREVWCASEKLGEILPGTFTPSSEKVGCRFDCANLLSNCDSDPLVQGNAVFFGQTLSSFFHRQR